MDTVKNSSLAPETLDGGRKAETEFFLGNLTGYALAAKERSYYSGDVAKVEGLLRQRDELLEALKRMYAAWNARSPIPREDADELEIMARAAIARAEGR